MVKYIILDLDLTVVCTLSDCNCDNHHEILVTNGKFGENPIYVHLRPFAKEFIKREQNKDNKFVIFSANDPEYVHLVSDIVFSNLNPPIAILTEEDLIEDHLIGYFVKTLETVSNKISVPIQHLIAIDDNLFMYPRDEQVISIPPWSLLSDLSTERNDVYQDTFFKHLEISN